MSNPLPVMPKIELHVHLEGATGPETVWAMAQRNRVALPAASLEEWRRMYQFTDFNHFIELFRAACRCLRTAADFELAAYDLGADLARQGVRYAEVTFSASIHHIFGVAQTA